jgi:DNA-binding MarR family transcriptional regulator
VGVIETSKSSIQVFKDIIKLKSDIENNRLPKLGSKTEKGMKMLKILFENPIITAGRLVEEMGIAHSTANRLLLDFEKLKIIEEYTGFKRNRKFIFKEYFEIFNDERNR